MSTETQRVLIRDLPVGARFMKGNDGVYVKTQEVGATGDGWCYCRKEQDNKLYRMQWDVASTPVTETKKVDVVDEADTEDFMRMRVRRAIAKAKEWHRDVLRSLRNDGSNEFNPEAARWQRNAYMARARRIRNEFARLEATNER